MVVEEGVGDACFAATDWNVIASPRWTSARMACSAADHPLWWVTPSWDYICYTGDIQYAKTYYRNLLAVLNTWYPSVTGPRAAPASPTGTSPSPASAPGRA